MSHPPRLFVPAITPLVADLSVDSARFVAHCRLLMADGPDDPGYSIVRPPLASLGCEHDAVIAHAAGLCFEGVPVV